MKLRTVLVIIASLALVCSISACSGKRAKPTTSSPASSPASSEVQQSAPVMPPQMPARYQSPGYITPKSSMEDDLGTVQEEFQLRVGATIKSTAGPQPVWDVLKKLANLKGMTVSWANDVDQNFLVDVDINAQDLFLDAVSNLLRQADYFYEVNGRTLIVRNKTTKVFHIGVPYIRGDYTTTVGGNFLTSKTAAEGTEGVVKITSEKNEYDIWSNVQKNLDVILGVAAREQAALAAGRMAAAQAAAQQAEGLAPVMTPSVLPAVSSGREESTQRAEDGAFYIVDKATGSITVTAKPSVMVTVENYINNLKKQLYRQISLEAKIIEVYLEDRSKIGLDWGSILENFNIRGTVHFGADGQVYPWIPTRGDAVSPTRFVSRITMPSVDFNVFLNALDQQGESRVLSNPKITVLNGQPALISVGKDVAYIKEVEREVSDTSGNSKTTYSVKIDNVVEGVSMGVMATIVDDHSMIMHLTPITTEIVGGVIKEERFGQNDEMKVGLPEIGVRQMSTIVQVANGEMLIIGGLIDSIQENTEKFAPVVGKIPIVKYLFGVEEKKIKKRELVILLSPHII
ncbi:MAG: pilus (MSHA type) biogenesis protein MshL [Desulfobulbaceae bacterium]|nr:pilus (MSHA type) biogenesis protein MshL [Desulfobulbaceae bacterium]